MRAGKIAPFALIGALLFAGCGKTRSDPPPPVVFYSLEDGEAAARRRHKLALVYFGADWSVAEKMLEEQTFPDPEVREALRDWILIKVDMTDDEVPGLREKQERFKVVGDPSIILIDFEDPERGELLRFTEFVPPVKMASAVRAAAARAKSRRAAAR